MFEIDVRTDIKQVTRHLNRVQRKVIPKVTVRALNETATAHRTIGLKKVAKDLKLTQKAVTGRFDKRGKKKGNRAVVVKANKFSLIARIDIHTRGIPLIQVVTRSQRVRGASRGRLLKGGIKAAGGRRYKRAFIAEGPAGSGNVQVFVRRGDDRYPLRVPKIGVRKRILKAYEESLRKTGGKVFKQRFERLMNFELSKTR